MVIGHAQFLADPLGKKIGHVMVFSDHVLSDQFIEKSAFFREFPIDCFSTCINETVNVRIELADTFQNVERSHAINRQVLAVIKGTPKGSGNMIDGINAFNGFFNVLVFAQVAEDGLNAFGAVPFSDPIDITRIDETADLVSFFE